MTSPFELNVSLPSDPRFAETGRELAIHAARQAGCTDAQAQALGAEVESLLRGRMDNGVADEGVPLVFRRADGPMEVRVSGQTLTIGP